MTSANYSDTRFGGQKDNDYNKPEPLFTAKDVADKLKISTKTLYRLFAQGVIPGLRIGRVIRFDMTKVTSALTSPQKRLNHCRVNKNTTKDILGSLKSE